MALKLEFASSKTGSRAVPPAGDGDGGDSVCSDGTRLTLRGLLHYPWDEAELTHRKPAFAGKRSWGTVRRHLLQAVQGKVVRGQPLGGRLYIPEPGAPRGSGFFLGQIGARWIRIAATHSIPQEATCGYQ